MPLKYDEIRSAVIDYIRANPKGQLPSNLEVFGSFQARGQHITEQDRETAREVFHELYLERVIISGAGANSVSHLMSWPFYAVTEYGKQVLGSPDYEPHDRDGYVRRLKDSIPAVDPDIIRYLDESLQCFQRGVLLASA